MIFTSTAIPFESKILRCSASKYFDRQLINNDSLPKRMRYYQASIDIADLAKGKQYKELHQTIIIFFCLFDPIGKGLPIYTFENTCQEDKNIKLNDGTIKIIINVNEYEKCENEKLRELLKYMKEGTVTNELTRRIDNMVNQIKTDTVAMEEYRFVSATIMDALEKGVKKGIKKGIQEGIQKGMEKGRMEGRMEGSYDAKIDTARKLIQMGMGLSREKIAEATGLTQEEIAKL